LACSFQASVVQSAATLLEPPGVARETCALSGRELRLVVAPDPIAEVKNIATVRAPGRAPACRTAAARISEAPREEICHRGDGGGPGGGDHSSTPRNAARRD